MASAFYHNFCIIFRQVHFIRLIVFHIQHAIFTAVNRQHLFTLQRFGSIRCQQNNPFISIFMLCQIRRCHCTAQRMPGQIPTVHMGVPFRNTLCSVHIQHRQIAWHFHQYTSNTLFCTTIQQRCISAILYLAARIKNHPCIRTTPRQKYHHAILFRYNHFSSIIAALL